jgi:hypothetical protein
MAWAYRPYSKDAALLTIEGKARSARRGLQAGVFAIAIWEWFETPPSFVLNDFTRRPVVDELLKEKPGGFTGYPGENSPDAPKKPRSDGADGGLAPTAHPRNETLCLHIGHKFLLKMKHLVFQ